MNRCFQVLTCAFITSVSVLGGVAENAVNPLRVGTFIVDASPPIGSALAYNRCDKIGMPLTARGIVLSGVGEPIVLCAVDWIGISNGGYDAWRESIAQAVGTSANRVSVHSLHQHDAPRCDFSAEELLMEQGLGGVMFDADFAHATIKRASEAATEALKNAEVVTHLGLGQAKVEKIASSRRIMGEDGKVRAVRYTACADPELRAEPEGIIDPFVKSISFWNEEKPIVVLTYYATHPQSYYLTGVAHPDFPGMARFLRQSTLNGLTHIHFTGAGGNVGAGKYNDGSPENRQVLAVRLADSMAKALQSTQKQIISAADVDWSILPVALPASKYLNEEALTVILNDDSADPQTRTYAAKDLVWLRRCQAGNTIDLTCLTLGPARILNMPGELAVEYQLAAQKMRPDLFVALGAYGEYAPGYICMEEHYQQGGYEDSPGASKVAPEVEKVLMSGMEQLLK